MAVQNIECQIATVLMKRFLDGDNLPQNLVDDLERHLKACTSCQAILNNETNSIEEILDQKVPVSGMAALFGRKQLQPAMAGGFATSGAGEALMNASYRTQVAPAPGLAVLKNPKVLFLSLALATVLIVMSTLLKNPTNLLGPKATMAAAGYTESKDEPKEDDTHGATATDGHEAEQTKDEHSEEPVDAHATPDPEADGHETPAADSHGEEPKHQPEMVNDPRVPGKPTLDQSDLIIAGGKDSTEHKDETHKKTTSTESHQTTAPKKTTSTSHTTTKTRKPAPKTTTRRSSPKPKSTGGGGIKVYDPSGKPINK